MDEIQLPHDSWISSFLELAADDTSDSDETIMDDSTNPEHNSDKNSDEINKDIHEHYIPVNCIQKVEGCKEVVNNYFNLWS